MFVRCMRCYGLLLFDYLQMSELFIDGYSEYELEALKIPADQRSKCLPQLVDYTKCSKKAGVARSIFNNACEDELFRFARCHQRSVNYSTVGHLAKWKLNNPSAFDEDKVSPTLESEVFNPTFLNFHR